MGADMKREKSAAQLRAANRGNVPGHLDMDALAKLSAAPMGRCSSCNRATWELQAIQVTCGFRQPDGTNCAGIMRRISP